MDSIKLSIFDLFGAIIPGLPIVILLSRIIVHEQFSFSILFIEIQELSLISVFLVVIISYLSGFSMQYLSYEVFKKLVKFWGKKRTKGFAISFGKRGKEISMIREAAVENSKVLNAFFAYRTMCYNAFFSLSLFAIGLFIHQCLYFTITNEIIFVCIFAFVFSILFLRRAVSFHEWGHTLISDSIEAINKLKNRS